MKWKRHNRITAWKKSNIISYCNLLTRDIFCLSITQWTNSTGATIRSFKFKGRNIVAYHGISIQVYGPGYRWVQKIQTVNKWPEYTTNALEHPESLQCIHNNIDEEVHSICFTPSVLHKLDCLKASLHKSHWWSRELPQWCIWVCFLAIQFIASENIKWRPHQPGNSRVTLQPPNTAPTTNSLHRATPTSGASEVLPVLWWLRLQPRVSASDQKEK